MGQKEESGKPSDPPEPSDAFLPELTASFTMLLAGMGCCGDHAEAKELRLVGKDDPGSLLVALRDVQNRPGLHPESSGLIDMFFEVAAGAMTPFDFRECCYRTCGVR